MNNTLLVTIISPILAALVTIIYEKYFRNKSELIVYYGYIAAHTLKSQNPLIVHTHSIVVRNIGKLSTHNVRIGHANLPEHHNVVPASNHSTSDIPGGGREILFPTLVPNEEVTISYLYFPPLTFQGINTYIKSDDGFARVVKVIPAPDLTGWKKNLLYILLFIGVSTAIFLSLMFAMIVYCVAANCHIFT